MAELFGWFIILIIVICLCTIFIGDRIEKLTSIVAARKKGDSLRCTVGKERRRRNQSADAPHNS
jgi:hypothetical protein